MSKAYLSMPLGTAGLIISELKSELLKNNDKVTYFKKTNSYNTKLLDDSDIIYFFAPSYLISYISDVNEFITYLGKGQFSELHRALEQKKKIVFIAIETIDDMFNFKYYSYLHNVINDYNDWKQKYGKVFLTDEILPIHQVEDNLLLLLCLP